MIVPILLGLGVGSLFVMRIEVRSWWAMILEQMAVAVIGMYLLHCSILEGRMMKTRKFLWGGASGLLYFMVLAVISLAAGQGLSGGTSHFITTLILCAAGGTLGGMVS